MSLLLTRSTPPSQLTLVARASAGPTAICHAKAIFAGVIGWRASKAETVRDTHARVGTNSPDLGISRV
jgi:hypothetical protein